MPYIPSQKTDGVSEDRTRIDPVAKQLAEVIAEESRKYGYNGAFAGELNYALTRLIQHLFRELVKTGESTSELRYWMQAITYGVLLDVALEHKVRVNQSYEIAQIIKNGDCYNTPYYSKPVEVVNQQGDNVGYIYVNMKRTPQTVVCNVFPDGKVVLTNKKEDLKRNSIYTCEKDCKNFKANGCDEKLCSRHVVGSVEDPRECAQFDPKEKRNE